jgi:cobalt/nickel transport system ATP-binding protein
MVVTAAFDGAAGLDAKTGAVATVIEASDLWYAYPGGRPALQGLVLRIAAGARVALLGANGSGKTTLLLHLNGLIRPDRGLIRIEGLAARYDRRSLGRWRTTVGLVLQDPDDQLFAGTVAEDVAFGPLNLGHSAALARAAAAAALARMAIAHLSARPIAMLSLGEKRRVAIAGVLAMEPRVLLLDEPTAGQDPGGITALLSALDPLAKAGRTIVLATHDVDLACAWADTVLILGDGRILAQGPPDRVLADDGLLARAALRLPLALAVGLWAQEHGLVDGSRPLPRSAAQVADLMAAIGAGRTGDHRPPDRGTDLRPAAG